MGTELVPMGEEPGKLIKRSNRSAIIRSQGMDSGGYVPHLGIDEVLRLADAANNGRHGERDRLMIQTVFDACLRISEALRLRPRDIRQDPHGWRLDLWGKGSRPGVAAISPSLAAQLQAYAYRHKVKPDARFFPFTRTRAFQIVDAAMDRAGITKPDHVGTVHVLRHSGALERLRVTGNPRAVQEQLRHQSARMTLRYLKTLTTDDAIRQQQQVDFGW